MPCESHNRIRPTTLVSRSASAVDFDGPYTLSIGGRLVSVEKTFPVYNPATYEVLAQAPEGNALHLEEAVAAAKSAFPAWSALPWEERSAYVSRYADALEGHKHELARLLTLEQGKPID